MDSFDPSTLDVDKLLEAVVIGGNALGARKGARKTRRRVPEKQERLVRLVASNSVTTFEQLTLEFVEGWKVVVERNRDRARRLAKKEFFRNIADAAARINAALIAGYEDERTRPSVLERTGSYVGLEFDYQSLSIGWASTEDLREVSMFRAAVGARHVRLKVPVERPAGPGDEPSGVEGESTPQAPSRDEAPASETQAKVKASVPDPTATIEIVVQEDPVTGVWSFELDDRSVEVVIRHGLVRVGGAIHETDLVRGLSQVEDLIGAPLDYIRRLIAALEEREALSKSAD